MILKYLAASRVRMLRFYNFGTLKAVGGHESHWNIPREENKENFLIVGGGWGGGGGGGNVGVGGGGGGVWQRYSS